MKGDERGEGGEREVTTSEREVGRWRGRREEGGDDAGSHQKLEKGGWSTNIQPKSRVWCQYPARIWGVFGRVIGTPRPSQPGFRGGILAPVPIHWNSEPRV